MSARLVRLVLRGAESPAPGCSTEAESPAHPVTKDSKPAAGWGDSLTGLRPFDPRSCRREPRGRAAADANRFGSKDGLSQTLDLAISSPGEKMTELSWSGHVADRLRTVR